MDRLFDWNLSNLIKSEAISVPGPSKIDQKSIPGPSWGTPGRPRSARGRPGASPARSRSAPRASRKRLWSTKWSNLSGLEFEQIQEPQFGSHFEQAGPQMIEFWIEFWAKKIVSLPRPAPSSNIFLILFFLKISNDFLADRLGSKPNISGLFEKFFSQCWDCWFKTFVSKLFLWIWNFS